MDLTTQYWVVKSIIFGHKQTPRAQPVENFDKIEAVWGGAGCSADWGSRAAEAVMSSGNHGIRANQVSSSIVRVRTLPLGDRPNSVVGCGFLAMALPSSLSSSISPLLRM